MVFIFFVAICLGIIISFPLSALGTYMINQTLQKGFWHGFTIALTAAGLDIIYCLTSLLGMSLIINIPWLRFGIQGIGLIFLIYIGYNTFFLKKTTKNPSKDIGHFKNGIFVFFYYLTNPTIFIFWVNLASILHGTFLINSPIWKHLFFSIGVGLGSLIINYIFLRLVIYGRKNLLSIKIIQKIAAIIYILSLVIFTYYLLSNIL